MGEIIVPTKEQHYKQYQQNKSLLNSPVFDAENTQYKDWVVTISFYTAVHLIEKKLAEINPNHHFTSHKSRNNAMNAASSFRRIAPQYKTLYDESRKARYDCKRFTNSDINLVLSLLEQIEQFAL